MMLLAATITLAGPLMVAPQKNLSILFLGNSHTTMQNLYAQVVRFLESDGSGIRVKSGLISGPSLKVIANNPNTSETIKTGHWDVVVFQGQEISMSHKFDYSKQETINLATMAKKSGARAVFFAEWPRRDIEETDYIYNIYQKIAAASGAEVAPVGYCFDAAIGQGFSRQLWMQDGNHSGANGAYLGALALYYWIAGTVKTPKFHLTQGMDRNDPAKLNTVARLVVDTCRKNPNKVPTAAQWRNRSGSTQGLP